MYQASKYLWFIVLAMLFNVVAIAETGLLTMGALGDSISGAMDATDWGDNPEYSWTTGSDDEVNSHAHRLSALGYEVNAFNEAVSGAKAEHLKAQVDLLKNQGNFDYVTMQIGANDACSWSQDHTAELNHFKTHVAEALQSLLTSNSQSKVLLVPVPNMYRIWELAHDMGCSALWDLVGICSPLLDRDNSDDERAAFQNRVVEINEALGQIAVQYPQQVRFDATIANTNFEWSDISPLDCFHPSPEGQHLLSQKSWDSGWYTKN